MIAMAGELIGFSMIFVSYLIGSIPSTYVIGKVLYGVDIREKGSGNVGGANAIRLFGKLPGVIGGLADILKGTFAIFLAKMIIEDRDVESKLFNEDRIIALVGFFVVFGHCYSIYLKFSGGKGGATTAGIILALDFYTFLILVTFWIIIVGSTRFTSLGNLLGIITVPLLLDYQMESKEYLYLGIELTILIYFKHRANIERLFKGEERKFGEKEELA
jgi:glycerol-3-phosphate acyltransferase PlsY